MKVHEIVWNVVGKIAVICITATIAMLFVVTPCIAQSGVACGTPGNPAVQLLPTIGLGVLRDTFCSNGPHDSSIAKPQLTIANKTNATLNVLLYSEDGTKYDLKLPQGTDNTWTINTGSYRSELIIPGFPSMSGSQMDLQEGQSYKWEIRRSEL